MTTVMSKKTESHSVFCDDIVVVEHSSQYCVRKVEFAKLGHYIWSSCATPVCLNNSETVKAGDRAHEIIILHRKRNSIGERENIRPGVVYVRSTGSL